MEKDIITFINDISEEKYKLLSVIDNQYIIYTDIDNLNPVDNINIIKVKSLNELTILPIEDNELKEIEQRYLDLLK